MSSPLSCKTGRDAGLERASLPIDATFPEGHWVGLYSSGGRVIKRSTHSRPALTSDWRAAKGRDMFEQPQDL